MVVFSLNMSLIFPPLDAMSSIVRLRIPEGDRPSLAEIKCQAAGCAGLQTLMDLMVKCWDTKTSKRPTSHRKKTTFYLLELKLLEQFAYLMLT